MNNYSGTQQLGPELKLYEKGLNVDGSREAMIAALKSHSSQG